MWSHTSSSLTQHLHDNINYMTVYNWWSLANQSLCVYAITLTLALVVGCSLVLTLSSARLQVCWEEEWSIIGIILKT